MQKGAPILPEEARTRLQDPQYIARLFHRYDQLRDEAPIHRVVMPGDQPLWLVSGYDHVMAVLKDRRFVSDIRHAWTPEERAELPETPAWLDPLEHAMIVTDAPDHTRLRRLVQPAFSPQLFGTLRPKIQEKVDELLDRAAQNGKMEFVQEFAWPLTSFALFEFLGFPVADRDKIGRWANAFIQFDETAAERPLKEFIAYLRVLLGRKQTFLGQDAIGELVRQKKGNEPPESELASLVVSLVSAGFEIAPQFLAAGTLTLLEHPDQLALLRQRPDLIKSAVEELLRVSATGSEAYRYASEDIPVGGVTIPRGEMVVMLLTSANFDRTRFVDPAQVAIVRGDKRHLAFGHGLHKCLGAPLARLEGEVVFATLVRRFPDLRLIQQPDNPTWRQGFPFLQMLEKMLIAF